MATINFLAGKIVSLKDDGTVNAGGKVTFYVADGTFSTPITTYSNKALTTPNSSPIILDSSGRAKAFFSGNADVRYLTSADVLIYSERDISPQNVKTVYSKSISFAIDSTYADSVIEITATLTATIASAATLGAGFSFTIVNTAATTSTLARANAGDTINGTAANITIQANSSVEVTVNSGATGFLVDTIGAFPVTIANGGTGSTTASAARTALAVGGIATNNTWTGTQTLSGAAIFLTEGADVASASSTNIWVGDGNTKHITGSVTINDFGTAPIAGAIMRCIANSTPTLANGANLITNNDGSNIVCRAEDSWWVFAETTTISKIFGYHRADGTALRANNTDIQTFTSAGGATWTKPSGFPTTARAIIECWAGGGSGAKVAATNHAGGGGGGGYSRREMQLSALGATEAVTVGAGGASQAVDGNTQAGTNTTFGAHLTAFAGAGGIAGNATEGAGGGGGGEVAAGVGDVGGSIGGSSPNASGTADARTIWGGGCGSGIWNNAGTPTASNPGNAVYGGGGGAGQKGDGTALAAGFSKFGGSGGAAKAAGTAPGGGGGGSSGVGASGAGAQGRCIVTVVS